VDIVNGSDIEMVAAERLNGFLLDGAPILCRRFGFGHINDTYLVVDDTARSYILQKINRFVFRNPLNVMCNIIAVINHLTRTALSPRHVLELTPARDGKLWLADDEEEYWRVYSFISDSVCYQNTGDEALFRKSAAAFGTFQKHLADFPALTLHETIPGFHNTPGRYAMFREAVKNRADDRLKNAAREIDFALEREAGAGVLVARYEEGALPLRVTHNDTKLNNVLFDRRTGESLCVIDLDTVMPGFSVTDFGDSIRYGASTAAEDERDLSKVSFSLRLFEAYAEGFLSACGANLTGDELDSLCDGAYTITLENGVRFLADYLSGDVYYRTSYDGHNLDRCRTQFKLVADMEASMDAMRTIINNVMSNIADYSGII
jgi:Ser/Thr protein kinase RdoA (MazF antagonist)